jgi:carbon storage regulator
MLILTRKIDQAIVIRDDILVRVLGVERDRVKLGICAPEEIVILREELCQHETPKNGEGKGEKHSKPTRPPSNGG